MEFSEDILLINLSADEMIWQEGRDKSKEGTYVAGRIRQELCSPPIIVLPSEHQLFSSHEKVIRII